MKINVNFPFWPPRAHPITEKPREREIRTLDNNAIEESRSVRGLYFVLVYFVYTLFDFSAFAKIKNLEL